MRTVADWLTSLGLAKYDTLFADNEIDWAVLPRLTDADLKDFGLPPGPQEAARRQQAVAATVQRYDGFFAKFLGDGVLAYFGYPQAHQGDAARRWLSASVLTLPGPP